MADLSDKDAIAQLSKKIDEQFKFLRTLTVFCCLAIVGCLFYFLSSMIAVVPDLVLAKFLGNVEGIHAEWQAIDKVNALKAKKASEK